MYKVLIVDDEAHTRNFLKAQIPLLDERFIIAGEAGDGLQALDFLQDNSVDLVLTDIKMPRMDGLQLSEQINRINKHQLVVILSGFDEFDFARQSLKYGIKDYLLKPIIKSQIKELLARIAELRTTEIQENSLLQELRSLQMESTDSVIRSFLQSVIMDARVEINTIYPLLHRFKINLFDGVGSIAVLSFDEEASLLKSSRYQDIEIYKYILYNVCKEHFEPTTNAWAFLDTYQNTCIFFTSDDQNALSRQMKCSISEIISKMEHTIGVTISSAMGNMEYDLLSLKSSYAEAIKKLLETNFANSDIQKNKEWIDEFSQLILQIKTISRTKDKQKLIELLEVWYQSQGNTNKSNVIRFMLYCLDSLSAGMPENKIVDAYQFLSDHLSSLQEQFTFKETSQLHAEMILILYDNDPESEVSLPLSRDNMLAQHIKEFIQENYKEAISLPMLADKFQLNATYISHLFHKQIGEPYVKFLNRTRMEQAAKLLADPSHKVYNVAEQVGYISVKHFNYVFKQYFEMTPTEFQLSKINKTSSM